MGQIGKEKKDDMYENKKKDILLKTMQGVAGGDKNDATKVGKQQNLQPVAQEEDREDEEGEYEEEEQEEEEEDEDDDSDGQEEEVKTKPPIVQKK